MFLSKGTDFTRVIFCLDDCSSSHRTKYIRQIPRKSRKFLTSLKTSDTVLSSVVFASRSTSMIHFLSLTKGLFSCA